MRDAGYTTGQIGKWDIDNTKVLTNVVSWKSLKTLLRNQYDRENKMAAMPT